MTILNLLNALPPAITTPLVNTSAYLIAGPTASAPSAPTPTPTLAGVPTPSAALTSTPLTSSGSPAPVPSITPSGAVAPVAPPTGDNVAGLGDFTWTQLVTLTGSLLAATGVIITLLFNASKSRRDALATLYADALGAVAAYLEGPYRILRKDGTTTTRLAITSKLSDVKTDIDHHQALLRLHARPGVADAYDAYVNEAKAEAGKQMHEAWKADAIASDADVNLNVSLPRGDADTARERLLAVMQADLARRWHRPGVRRRYDTAVTTATPTSAPAPSPPSSQITPAPGSPAAATTSTHQPTTPGGGA